MKQWKVLILGAWMSLCFMHCKKVEVLPVAQDDFLPLAVGNRWVYIDSLITTTSLPSADTVVKKTSYHLSQARLVDRYASGKRMQRLQGWELLNSTPISRNEVIVQLGDTIYSSSQGFLQWDDRLVCNGIHVNLQDAPAAFEAYSGRFHPVFSSNPDSVAAQSFYPLFFDFPYCIDSLGPKNFTRVYYQVDLLPWNVDPSVIPITTPAGTFECEKRGVQYWCKGVGMVLAYVEGETTFLDSNHVAQTALLKWKRTLNSYRLE